MTDIARVRAWHYPIGDDEPLGCYSCGAPWPCHTAQVLALADELAHWGAQLAHLAVGLKTGRDLDRAIGEWEKAIAKWEASRAV